MPDYTVNTAGFILGDWKNVNKTITLTEKQAIPFLRDERIALKGAKSDEKPAKAGAKS